MSGTGSVPALVEDTSTRTFAHGLWVWKSPTILQAPQGAQNLQKFCQSEGITEVYVSFSDDFTASDQNLLAILIALLHASGLRVEALLSSTDADEPGEPRTRLLTHVQKIMAFNQAHALAPFDGIHLDIEPQQRPENKGANNLIFVPGLVDAYSAVRQLTDPAGMTVNADVPIKVLKGDLTERKMLLSALPRLTLMLYGLSTSGAGDRAEKLRTTSRDILASAYSGLDGATLAKMLIGLRTADYGDELPQMLKTLDEGNRNDPNYVGWAWESYVAHQE
jgi:hypothetical protein